MTYGLGALASQGKMVEEELHNQIHFNRVITIERNMIPVQ